MKVILIDDVNNIGKKGEIKEVKNGLARNYLIPKKLAIRANPGNIKIWEQKLQSLKHKDLNILDDAKAIASSLENVSISIPMKAGEEDKLFGSVTSQNISDSLKEKGYDIDKKDIVLEELIKSLGQYTVPIKLHPEVNVNISVEVIKEED